MFDHEQVHIGFRRGRPLCEGTEENDLPGTGGTHEPSNRCINSLLSSHRGLFQASVGTDQSIGHSCNTCPMVALIAGKVMPGEAIRFHGYRRRSPLRAPQGPELTSGQACGACPLHHMGDEWRLTPTARPLSTPVRYRIVSTWQSLWAGLPPRSRRHGLRLPVQDR